MHNRDKYPAIFAEMEAAQKELDKLMTARKEHTDAIAGVQVKIETLKAKKEELNSKAMKDADQVKNLSTVISRCAIAMGAVRAG